MFSDAKNNPGTCFGCKQSITAVDMFSHFEICRGKSMAARHKQHSQAENIFMIRVDMENQFWLFAEVKGSTLLQNLYMFLRSSWFECCGHISPFVIDGKELSGDYMQQTVGDMFVTGDRFHYSHKGTVEGLVIGHVIAVYANQQDKAMQIASQMDVAEERCETCIAEMH
jgi:hypothetical protein